MGALARAFTHSFCRTRSRGAALVPRVGSRGTGRELPGPRALLAPAAVDHRPLHRVTRWTTALGGSRTLQSAPHRHRGGDPRRRLVTAHGSLDPVVVARERTISD